ncbi:MAG: glycosyltransferase family 4 protein [Elusimicrobia bacterium]|nr:glycosyltransferase family 4 protein [Elusimicrobiota bacterium]
MPSPRRRLAIAARWIEGSSGAETLILEHARRFATLGWEVHLYGERLDEARIRQAGALSHRLRTIPWGSYLKRRIFAWRFERAARKLPSPWIIGHGDTLRQDMLFLHNCVHGAHEAVHGAPLPGGSGAGRMHERILRERRFRLLVANSELMRQDIGRRFDVPQERMTVIHPGHDPAQYKPEDRPLGASVRRQLGAGPDRFLIGLVTSGDFRKRGVDLFLQILGRLPPDTRRNVRAVVLGKESNVGAYQKLAAKAGLRGQVAFLPPQPNVSRYYHALDVFLYPALFEEFGMSVLEAMACRVPVLTSRRVGAAELFKGQWADIALEQPEPEAFAARLEALLNHEELRRRYGEASVLAARETTWARHFQRVTEASQPLWSAR